MGIVEDMLSEERSRLLELEKFYVKQISRLPRGSISMKRRGSREYCYLAYRDGRKVRFDYVGGASSEAASKLQAQIRKRREIEKKLERVVKNLREIERGLRGVR